MRFIFAPFYAGGLFLVLVFGMAMLAFKIWMLVDAVKRPETDFNPPTSRVLWIVGLAGALFLSIIGLVIAIAYYVLVRRPLREGQAPGQIFGGSGGGARGGRVCSNCGHPLGTHTRFCQNCGTAIQEEMNE